MASLLEVLQSQDQPAQQAQPQPEPKPAKQPSALQKALAPQAPERKEGQVPQPSPAKPEIPQAAEPAEFKLTPLQQTLGVSPEQAQFSQRVARRQEELRQRLVQEAAQKADPQRAPFIRGLISGVQNVEGTLHSLKALGASVVDDPEALRDAAEALERLQAEREVLRPRVDKVEDLVANPNLADFVEWAAFNLGEQVPNIASIVAGGGFSGFVGRKIAQLKARDLVDDMAARQLTRVYTERGAKIGAFSTAMGLETGATTEEQLMEVGEISPLVAVGAGAAKAGLEILTPVAVAQRFGLSEGLAGNFVKRLSDRLIKGGLVRRTASGGLAIAGSEAATEGLQETIDNFARSFVDENFDALGPEARSRILNAAAVGGLVGFAPGAVTGATTTTRTPSPELSAAEIGEVLQPTPEFRTPGGFRVIEPTQPVAGGALPDTEAGTRTELVKFSRPEEVELQRTPGQKLEQVDVSQLAVEDLTATLEGLPDTVSQLRASVREVPDKVVRALTKRNKAIEKQLTTTDVKRQQEAAQELQEAERLYAEAVQEGFRFVPEGGVEQLAREGLMYAGRQPIPQTAVREVRDTGFRLDPQELITVNFKPGEQLQEARLGQAMRGNAFVQRSELADHEVTASPEDLTSLFQEPELGFAPDVSPEQQTRLREEFHEKVAPNKGVEAVRRSYASLVERGLRVKPRERASHIALAGVSPRRLRPIPAQLDDPSKLWRGYGRFSSPNSLQGLVVDVNHKNFDPKKHRPGKVQFFFEKNELDEVQHANMMRAVRAAQDFLRKAMPDLKLVITSRSQTRHAFIGSHAAYYDDNFGLIYLNKTDIGTKQKAAQVFFHELGHIISAHALQHANKKQRSAIFTAWLRHLTAQQRQSASEFWLGFSTPQRVNFYSAGRAAIQLSSTGTAAEAIADRGGFQQWYQFDEWFAEQTAKWALTPETEGANIVNRFFKRVFERMKQLVEHIQLRFGLKEIDFSVDQSMQSYLDDLVRKHEVGHQAAIYSMAEEPLLDDRDLPAQPSYGVRFANHIPETELGPKPKQVQDGIDKYAWYVRWGWNIVQLAQKNPHISGLQRYVERVRAWHIEKMKWISRAEERIVEWRNLGKEMSQRLSDFIWEIESMQYLKPNENARQPTLEELKQIGRKYKLNREALELFLRIREDFDAVLGQIERVWIRDAVASITDEAELGKAVNRIQQEMRALRSRPYFPHARFGEYVLSVRDSDGKLVVFKQFENQRARDDAAKLAREDFPDSQGYFVQTTIMPEDVRSFRGMPPSFLDTIAQRLNLTAEQQDWLEQLKFDMSPANSWAKHLKKRKGVPGFSTDAQRAYANYFFHGANHLARILHRGGLEDAIKEVTGSVRQLPDADRRMGIVNYMRRHLDYIMNPPNELASWRSLGFTWLLGFAPDSAFVNTTQIPLVAWPYLSARFGGSRLRLMSAAKDLRQLWMQNKALPEDRLKAQQLGIEQGIIDQSYASELAATAHGSGLSRLVAGTKRERTIAGLGRAAAFMFRMTEKMNRVIVFDAAYQLGRDNARSTDRKTKAHIDELIQRNGEFYEQLVLEGWTHENAVGYLAARDAVERTMFEYSQWARPEFMRGKKGVLFTFFMFTQNMLWFERYSPGNKRHLALLLAFSGLLGFPLAEDLNDVLKAVLTKAMGRHFNLEEELRLLMAELTERPDLIMRGLGRDTFGMRMVGDMTGIPLPGFDLSARIGMGRVVPGVAALTAPAMDFDTRMARTVEDVIGASYGVPYNVVQGVAGFEPNNLKTYERLVPRFLKNAGRAYRWYTEGEETTFSGATLRKFDPTDPESMLEVVGGAMGFQPTGLRQQWDRAAAEREVARYWHSQRVVLYDQFWRAARARDREAIADVRNNIKQFNREVPFGGLRITAKDLKQSLLTRRRRQIETEAGVPAQRGLIGAIRRTQEAYPEAPPLR